LFDVTRIMEVLPHRYPFLLVDRITLLEDGHVVGFKNVTINEPFFVGHFPGRPVMPGVLILESMGQVAAAMVMARPDRVGRFVYLTGIEGVKFRRPVVPGDVLVTEAWLERVKGNFGKARARSTVEDKLVAEAVFSFAMLE